MRRRSRSRCRAAPPGRAVAAAPPSFRPAAAECLPWRDWEAPLIFLVTRGYAKRGDVADLGNLVNSSVGWHTLRIGWHALTLWEGRGRPELAIPSSAKVS